MLEALKETEQKKKNYLIWKKVKYLLKIKLDSEPVYGDNDENIKKNIEMYAGNANTNSQSKGVPKMHHANVYHYQ